MMIRYLVCLESVVFSLLAVCSGLRWSTPQSPPDKQTLPVCPGSEVNLTWAYLSAPGERLVDVEWRYKADVAGSSEVVLATQVNGHFFADSSSGPHIQATGQGVGLRLPSAQVTDSGLYSVHVNMENNNTAIQSHEQSVHVVVTADPIAENNSLQAHVQGAQFINSTQQFQLVLTCGTIKPLWAPQTQIVWTTPSKQTLASTEQDSSGHFSLALPNPVLSGTYTCKVSHSCPASRCLPSDSPLRSGVSVEVEGVGARLLLMEEELRALGGRLRQAGSHNAQLTALVQQVRANNSLLASLLHTLKEDNARLQQTMLTLGSGEVKDSCDFEASLCGYTQSVTDQFDWTRKSGPTSSANTGPHFDHTFGNATGHYMYTEASNTPLGASAILQSPMESPKCSDICVSFYYHMYGSGVGSLSLRVSNSTSVSDPLFSLNGNQGNRWSQAKVNVSADYLSSPYQILFESRRGASYAGDIAIDDISVTSGACH